jgi:hypothetical protein
MVVLAVAAVLKVVELERLLGLAPQAKVPLVALVPPLLMAAVAAVVLEALVLLVLIGFLMEVLLELGLVMVDWASKAQLAALQHLMVAAVGLGQLGLLMEMVFIEFQVMVD